MRDEVEDTEKREGLLSDIFSVLDQKRRNFISRVELAHILDAMLADASIKFTLPESLTPADNMKDSRVNFQDLRNLLSELTIADLEDVKWFAESVVKVETELREVWRKAVQGWRQRVERLYVRNLHRYLLISQPERVSRWLLLRTSMDELNTDDSSIGLLGLGISQQEVEVLFTDETADDINRCIDKIEPFLTALELRGQLYQVSLEGDRSAKCPTDVDARVAEILTKLVELAERCRELACLLIHEDTLCFATALTRSAAFSQAVISEASKLIMVLINYRVHENARDYERLCRQRLAKYLEIEYSVDGFDLQDERRILNTPLANGRLSLVDEAEESDAPRSKGRSETVAEWVGSLLTLGVDFDRGEMLDVLIKYDERRLALQSDGGERVDETAPIAMSLFSFGRTVPHVLSRLDVSSHHSLHEHRTPMRTHLWKFLLNVLSSVGDRGRGLFRAAEGMRVICNVVRGSTWGVERDEITVEEEDDQEEEDELYQSREVGWGLRDPYHSWPYVECFEEGRPERWFYRMDFLDDRFYGPKDRMLAAAFLEYMSAESMWGEELLVEEMMQYPNSLQVLCRVRPPGCFLLKLLLTSPKFPEYLERTAQAIAEGYAERSLQMLIEPDATCHSLFPVCTFGAGRSQAAGRPEAIDAFRREIMVVEKQNAVLRILSHGYHCLQACLQEERSMREGEASKDPLVAPGQEEPQAEASQLEAAITECCRLLASQLPLTVEEIGDVGVAVCMQVKEFTRKALLSVSRLPPVNPDERQKARDLECAKTVPPRPMYFGHYQNLIYNQSNPMQPSARSLDFEGESRGKCLQGAADIHFTGEHRYLSEPSLFPYEFLVVLRMVQLVRLREPSVPAFLVELQENLEQLTGQSVSFASTDSREDLELAGAEYPWRTGLAQLETFRVSQVPLRRSQLRRHPRSSPLAVIQGMESILQEYQGLDLWEEDLEGSSRTSSAPKDAKRTEELSQRRNVLIALVFNHLCYYHPKSVTLEDSASGLSLRLGVSLELLVSIKELLAHPSFYGLEKAEDFAEAQLPESCKVSHGTPGQAVTILQLSVADKTLAFVCMMGVWMMWANCAKDNAQVLTECSNSQRYFAFET